MEKTIKYIAKKKNTLKTKYVTNKSISKISEHRIQNAIIRYLLLKGYLVIRYNSGSVKTENRFTRFYTIENSKKYAGHPDLIFSKNGKSYFVEVKTEKGKQTQNQKDFQEICERHNMTYLIIRNLEEIIEFLRTIEWLKNDKH